MTTAAPAGIADWEPVEALPSGSVLLHIGPFKTGTTAIQESLARSRPVLAEHDVRYPGTRHHTRAAMSAIRRTTGWAGRDAVKAPKRDWRLITDEVAATPGRVVISSEYFCIARRPKLIHRICDDVGMDRVQVVITLRSFGRLLPSNWQQYIKSGKSISYEDWLQGVLAEPPDPEVTPTFWARNDHAALVRRWADVVGADRVTVVVLDEADRGMMYGVFERLLALPRGTLLRPPADRSNRSLSAVECELIRQVNVEVEAQQVSWNDYMEVIRSGAVRRLVDARDPDPGEARITTPDWALARAAEIGTVASEGITASGVRVVGDLATLGAQLPTQPNPPVGDNLPVAAVAELLLGALSGSMRRGPRFAATPHETWPPPPKPAPEPASDAPRRLAEVPTSRLLQAVRRRARRRLRRRTAQVSRRVRRKG